MVSLLQNLKKDKINRFKFKNSEMARRHYKLLKIRARSIGYIPLTNFTKIFVKNYCLVTGHAHSVYSKKFRMSRHQIKKYFGYITGLTLRKG